MRIAIYDLDRTLTRKPTFTPFLLYGAWHIAPWRLIFAPVWVLAMIGYRLGFYSRTALKTIGMRMMIGAAPPGRLRQVGQDFAKKRIGAQGEGLMPATIQMLGKDRADGAVLIVATAAFEFYAEAFADALDIPNLIATRWDGAAIPGGNCYGAEKKRRVLEWMQGENIAPEQADMRFVSDSFADSPLLGLADEAVFVTTSASKAARAKAEGWAVLDPLGPRKTQGQV